MSDSVFEFILYVSDQQRSRDFYSGLFQINPCLDVPGMTEFELSKNLKLGLMPENGIARILEDKMPHPASGHGIPRCELYLLLDDYAELYERSVVFGALEVSKIQDRDWGHSVGYVADPDGHIIAFAKKL